MRFSTYYPLGLFAAALLAGCNGDPVAPTAPTTPSFTQTLVPNHTYRFTLSCSSAAPLSTVVLSTSNLGVILPPLLCGGSLSISGFNQFRYDITVQDQSQQVHIICNNFVGGTTTTGVFKCKLKQWWAMLTVTDLGETPI